MRRNRLVSVFAAAAVAGALLLGGCTSAVPKSSPTRGTATTDARPAGGSAVAAPSGGAVHFTGYTDNDGPTSTAILTGAVGDYGKAQSVNPDGTVNLEHNSELDLALAQGSFRLSIADLDKKFVSAMSTFPSDKVTCSGAVTVAGTSPVVAGSGTGSYKGISGTFNLTLELDEVDPTLNCSTFLAQVIVITGSGTVSFS